MLMNSFTFTPPPRLMLAMSAIALTFGLLIPLPVQASELKQASQGKTATAKKVKKTKAPNTRVKAEKPRWPVPAPKPPSPIYRCSDERGQAQYSQLPCATSAAPAFNAAADMRNPQQLKEAKTVAQREQRLLKSMRKDTARDQASVTQTRSPKAAKPNRTQSAKATETASNAARASNKHKPERFRAISPHTTAHQGLHTP